MSNLHRTLWVELKHFRLNARFLANYVCRVIFASFHQGKEEKYIAFLCIPMG
jgi:hypothetical protein